MAVPKRRTSKARQRSRSAHFKAYEPKLGLCPQCHNPKRPHRICPSCGYYRGREVVKVEEKK